MSVNDIINGGDSPPAESIGPVSPVTLALVFTLFVAAAMACTLGAYYAALQQSNALAAAGFVHWQGSADGWDNFPFSFSQDAPGANIWYHFEQGSRLTFVFLNLPLLHAAGCGGAIMLASLLGALSFGIARVNIGPPVLLTGLMAFGFFGLGIYSAFPSPPQGFVIDIAHGQIGDNLDGSGESIAYSPQTTFRTFYYSYASRYRYDNGWNVMASNGAFQSVTLVMLAAQQEAAGLQSLLTQFVQSGGGNL
jgi:hypothetical protein